VTRVRPARRPGFTLLELLLALGLGVVLLGALYVALDTTLQQTQTSRDAADVEGLSRAVFNKVGVDLANVLGPVPPKSGGGVPETATPAPTTPAPTTTTPSATTPPATTTPTDMAAAETEADPDATAMEDPAAGNTTPATNLPLQLGVVGDGTRMTVFASRVPFAGAPAGQMWATADGGQQMSDLVRVDYGLAPGGGLYRRESPWVTAQGVGDVDPSNVTAEPGDVIADEVTGVLFEYHDGTGYVESWSGGGSVPAPPRAVRVTLTFSFPNPRGGDPIERTVSQVIVVRTAPGDVTPELTDPVVSSGATPAPATDPAAAGGSGTTGGSGGTSPASSGSGSSGTKPSSGSGGNTSSPASSGSGGKTGGASMSAPTGTGSGHAPTGGTTGSGGTGGTGGRPTGGTGGTSGGRTTGGGK
jgi:prepilin-type N-terminal cleavage/methylation domain-containing protein